MSRRSASRENLCIASPIKKSPKKSEIIVISSDSEEEVVTKIGRKDDDLIVLLDNDLELTPTKLKTRYKRTSEPVAGAVEDLASSFSDFGRKDEDLIVLLDNDPELTPTKLKTRYKRTSEPVTGAVEDLASSFSDSTKIAYSNLRDSASKYNFKRKISTNSLNCNTKSLKKREVRFGNVTEVSFLRQQGYTCVPSKSGATLGMAKKHSSIDHFTIDDYEKKKLHRVYREKLNISSQYNKNYCDNASQNKYLQPISAKERLNLLRDAGIENIDDDEKEHCNLIRTSREICGCECKDYCDPDVCSCILSDIPCQIERPNFPCGCTVENCKNPNGCNMYNFSKVQNHFIKTMRKLRGK